MEAGVIEEQGAGAGDGERHFGERCSIGVTQAGDTPEREAAAVVRGCVSDCATEPVAIASNGEGAVQS